MNIKMSDRVKGIAFYLGLVFVTVVIALLPVFGAVTSGFLWILGGILLVDRDNKRTQTICVITGGVFMFFAIAQMWFITQSIMR